ncbi:MAG TPA: hypothetical protein VGI90_02075 [Steroidobacteraceae bacterium]|jgi:ElaB/YqjD/DUF883 family membrane-anchored ribosome-binding protein
MSMATLLKGTANLLMGLSLVKLVAGDLGAEFRHDAAGLGRKTGSMIRRSPYRAAGSAAALGFFAGILLSQHRNRSIS